MPRFSGFSRSPAGLFPCRRPLHADSSPDAHPVGAAVARGPALVGRTQYFHCGLGITFGLSVGAGMILHSYIFAEYYGRTFLGSIRGIVLPVMLISNAVGAPLVGYIHDSTGSYVSSWWMILSMYLLAGLIVSTAKKPAPLAAKAGTPAL